MGWHYQQGLVNIGASPVNWVEPFHTLEPASMTTARPIKKRNMVSLTAVWGNDDAESTVRISLSHWKRLVSGSAFTKNAWAWYEGRRYQAQWVFKNGCVTIHGPDAAVHVVDLPLDELFVQESS